MENISTSIHSRSLQIPTTIDPSKGTDKLNFKEKITNFFKKNKENSENSTSTASLTSKHTVTPQKTFAEYQRLYDFNAITAELQNQTNRYEEVNKEINLDDVRAESYKNQLIMAAHDKNRSTGEWSIRILVRGGTVVDLFKKGFTAASHALSALSPVSTVIGVIAHGIGLQRSQTLKSQNDQEKEFMKEQTAATRAVLKEIIETDQLGKLCNARLEAVKKHRELEKLLGDPPPKSISKANIEQLIKEEKDKREANSLNAPLKKISLKDSLNSIFKAKKEEISSSKEVSLKSLLSLIPKGKSVEFEDLQTKYAEHTALVSIKALENLQRYAFLKRQGTTSLFSLKRNQNAGKLTTAIVSGAVLLTMTAVVLAGISLPATAMGGIGLIPLAASVAIGAVGLGVLAYFSPHQAKAMTKPSYLYKIFRDIQLHAHARLLLYKPRIKSLRKEVFKLQNQLNLMNQEHAGITKKKLSNSEKLFYKLHIGSKKLYVLKSAKDLEDDIERLKGKEKKLDQTLKSIYHKADQHRNKISEALMKDFAHSQVKFRYNKEKGLRQSLKDTRQARHEYKENLKQLIDTTARTVAADIARETDDFMSKSLVQLLISQCNVTIPPKSSSHKTDAEYHQEVYQSVKEGLIYFMGADSSRMAVINTRLRQGRHSAHRLLIANAFFHPDPKIQSNPSYKNDRIFLVQMLRNMGIKDPDWDPTEITSDPHQRGICEEIRKKLVKFANSSEENAKLVDNFYQRLQDIYKPPKAVLYE